MNALPSARPAIATATRQRQVIGTFGAETVKAPRARLVDDSGLATEWRSQGRCAAING